MSHLTIAASEKAFEELFKLVRDGFTLTKSDSASFGPFSASYSIALHLNNGSVHLNDDGTVEIDALDVVWDTLKFTVCFDFPGFTIPGFCIIPDPWNGCLVGIPDIPIRRAALYSARPFRAGQRNLQGARSSEDGLLRRSGPAAGLDRSAG
jgi:hypothetical protein